MLKEAIFRRCGSDQASRTITTTVPEKRLAAANLKPVVIASCLSGKAEVDARITLPPFDVPRYCLPPAEPSRSLSLSCVFVLCSLGNPASLFLVMTLPFENLDCILKKKKKSLVALCALHSFH